MELLENNFGKLRCEECDSVIRIEGDNDFEYSYNDDCYTVTCPVCGATKWLEKRNALVQFYIYRRITHK
jgi:rubrerythrin